MSTETTTLKTLENLKVDFIAGVLGRGGAERQLYYMAKVLAEVGAKIRILSLTSGEAYQREINELGIPIIYVGRFSSRIIRLCKIIWELKKDPPQIVHSAHFFTNLYAAIAARMVGAQDIGTVRTDLLFEIKDIPLFWRWSLSYPSFLTTNARQVIDKSFYCGLKPASVYLLENTVDTGRFRPAEKKAEIQGGSGSTVRIVCIARLTSEKRVDLFLRVLSEIHQIIPSVRARIIGDGPLRRPLEELSRQLGLGPNLVEFTGIIDDMPSVYQQADLLVLTSVFEGMPNVILEAMACGLPVVATGVGAVPEIVNHGVTGYVVSINDTHKLIRYLLRLVRSSTLRRKMGMKTRAVVEKSFSLESLQQRLLSLYGLVLASKNK